MLLIAACHSTSDSQQIESDNLAVNLLEKHMYPATAGKDYDTALRASILSNMVFVQGGTFLMGCTAKDTNDCNYDELPLHEVYLNGFYISKHEFTNRQFHLVAGNDFLCQPWNLKECPDCPYFADMMLCVMHITRTLYEKTGLRFRLPTEAEWEYAARGGKMSDGYLYPGSNNLDEVAWYGKNSKGRIHPVGLKKPNELGLYDMAGNASERVIDLYDPDFYKYSDKRNPVSIKGEFQVIRGEGCLSIYEYTYTPYYRFFNPGGGWYYPPGFRLCLDSVQLARLTNGEF